MRKSTLRRPGGTRSKSGRHLAASVFLFISSVYAPQGGHAQSRPEFEVASVRLSGADDRAAAASIAPGGRFTANIGLRYIIELAYDLQDYQLSGDPAWAKSERYAIEAKAAGPASDAQVRLMVQTLLADRFHLKIHRENRELPVYALVVGKGGPKLEPAKDSTLCGGQGCFGISRGSVTSSGGTLARLSTVLTRILDRPVFNKTELAGNYDFKLHFDQRSGGHPRHGPRRRHEAGGRAIHLHSGAGTDRAEKLDPRKESVEVLGRRPGGKAHGELNSDAAAAYGAWWTVAAVVILVARTNREFSG